MSGHPALGSDIIVLIQGLVQFHPFIDIVQDELNIVVGVTPGFRLFDARIGSPDTGVSPHRYDEKQPSIVGEERKHSAMRGQLPDNQMNALGEHMTVFGGLVDEAVMLLIGERTGGVDQHSWREQ
ncbi:MAG: hypothetical protein R3F37_20810 [Candidatus Competibacteraceae bacterium]